MVNHMIDPRILDLAAEHLTPNQHEAWTLSIRGLSQRDIALHLGVSRTTAVDRIDRAWQKLAAHGVSALPSGQPHLEETA